jgi:hypothetical protein
MCPAGRQKNSNWKVSGSLSSVDRISTVVVPSIGDHLDRVGDAVRCKHSDGSIDHIEQRSPARRPHSRVLLPFGHEGYGYGDEKRHGQLEPGWLWFQATQAEPDCERV